MSLKPRTIGLAAFGAALVIGLAYVSFRPDPIAVDLHEIRAAPMQVTIGADGKTQIRDIFEVSAPIAGTALRSPVQVGDEVFAGQTIVAVVKPVQPGLLDARSRLQAEAAIREAEAARHVAETDLNKALEDVSLAQVQYDRAKTLVDRGALSIARLEDAAQKLAVTTASVEAAQARIDMSVSSLERSQAALIDPNTTAEVGDSCCVEILAPADGVVLSINTISERPVLAGSPLVSIGDPDNIELVVDLLSGDAVRLQPGATARVERWGGDTPLTAVLDRVEPAARTKVSALGIEEQRVDAILTLTSPLENRPELGDGFAVFVHLVEWQSDEALQIPLSALFKRGEVWTAFVANNNVVEERSLTLGRRNNRFAEIRGGIEAGERVIMHPSDALAVGSSIVERGNL